MVSATPTRCCLLFSLWAPGDLEDGTEGFQPESHGRAAAGAVGSQSWVLKGRAARAFAAAMSPRVLKPGIMFLLRMTLAHLRGEYPASFRSPLTAAKSSSKTELSCRCHCGQSELRFRLPEAAPIRCHCPSCRRFHSSAFGAYLAVDAWEVTGAMRYQAFCSQLGPVERHLGTFRSSREQRLACEKCFSKLGTISAQGSWARR